MKDERADERPLGAAAGADSPADAGATSGGGMAAALVALRRRWGVIAVAIALGALAGGLLRAASEPSYTATTKLLLEQQRPVDALLGLDQPSADPTRDLSTSVRLIVLGPVADQVRRRLGVPGSTDALLARVSVKLDGNTNIVDITARDKDPRQAARIADAFAIRFRRLSAQSAGASLAEAVRTGRERLRRLGPDAGATPVGRDLAREIRRLEILGALRTGGVQIVRRATVPASPSGMGVVMAAVLGGLVGALLGAGLALVRARVDRRLDDEDDVERSLGLEVLAVVPQRPRSGLGRPTAGGRDDELRDDAYATLGARVAFAKPGGRRGALLVSSPGEGEGTAEVVLGLVGALSVLGRCALAIDADLRAGRLTELAGAERRAGLAALLTDERRAPHGLHDDVVPLPAAGPLASRPQGSAWLLPAGPVGASPQALLGGPRMASLVDEARPLADDVVIAAGPLAEAGHPISLAHAVDGVLLVVRRGRTRQAAARRAVRNLQALEVPILGAVLTGAPRRRGDRRAPRVRGRPRSRQAGEAVPDVAADHDAASAPRAVPR